MSAPGPTRASKLGSTNLADDRRLTKKDHAAIAETIAAEYSRRRSRRTDLEALWDDVDRQVMLQPVEMNRLADGSTDPRTAWMPWFEESWQSTALEVIVSDLLEMLLPEGGKFFASLPDTNGELLDGILSEISADWYFDGRETKATADDVRAIVDAVHLHFMGLYDFRGVLRSLLVDAVKYGAFAAKVRIVQSDTFSGDYRGTYSKSVKFPALVHYPIRNVYLDDSAPTVWTSGETVGPAHIWTSVLKVAALKRLSGDGWLPAKIAEFTKGLAEDDDVTLVEYSGDLVVPRSTVPSIFLPACVATVASCSGAEPGNTLVRYQENPYPFRTWITDAYFPTNLHVGGKPSPYGSAPLLNGHPLQRAGSNLFTRMTHAALLNARPPVSYDPDTTAYAVSGGPDLYPGALIPDPTGALRVHQIGNLDQLAQVWTQVRQAYMEVTGVLPGRISGMSKSHQTLGAVQTEQERSASRTVTFGRSLLTGLLRTYLAIAYELGKDCLRGRGRMIYVPKFRDFVNISSRMLPEACEYDVFGSGEPQAAALALTKKLNALTLVAKSNEIAVQQGGRPMDWDRFRLDVMEDAGIDNPEQYLMPPQPAGAVAPDGTPLQPGVPSPGVPAIGPATPSVVPGAGAYG